MRKKYFALLVEDNYICQKFQKSLLELNGFNIDIAATAKAAIEKLNKMEEQFNRITYHVIFVDFMLPDINGDDLAQIIRLTTHKESPLNENIPIIAVTAYANQETKDKLYKSGVAHIIQKPMTKNNLNDITLLLEGRSKKIA